MKKNLLAVLAASFLTVGATAPQAEEGAYGGILGGWVSNNEQKFNSGVNGVGNISTTFDNGYNVSIFGGYNYGVVGNGSVRTELELSWRESEVKKHKSGGSNLGNPKGKMTERAGFINAYYDFDGSGSAWVPYVGAGVGYGQVDFKDYGAAGITVLDDSKNLWGYQAIAGIGYQFNPQTRVFVDYRYRGYQEAKLKTEAGNSTKITPNSNSLNLGLLFSF